MPENEGKFVPDLNDPDIPDYMRLDDPETQGPVDAMRMPSTTPLYDDISKMPKELRDSLLISESDEFVEDNYDDENESKGNVLGTNPETGRQIVSPKKVKESIFSETRGAPEKNVFEGKSFEEVMAHVKQITDYRPMTLPSRGYLYPKGHQCASGSIFIRPMRSEEEEIIFNTALLKSGEGLEMILKRCVMVSQDMRLTAPLDLLSQDRTAILIFLRGLLDTIYQAQFTCERCGHAFEVNIDLDNDLDCLYCENPDIREPFQTVLPQSGLIVEYRLPRGRDDLAIMNHIEDRKKKRGMRAKEDGLTFKLMQLVTGIQGCVNQGQREQVIKMITTKDLNHIRHQIDYPPFGVDTALTVECPKCNAENKTRLPINMDFFSPQSAKPNSSESSQ
jgi:hypothetical protein